MQTAALGVPNSGTVEAGRTPQAAARNDREITPGMSGTPTDPCQHTLINGRVVGPVGRLVAPTGAAAISVAGNAEFSSSSSSSGSGRGSVGAPDGDWLPQPSTDALAIVSLSTHRSHATHLPLQQFGNGNAINPSRAQNPHHSGRQSQPPPQHQAQPQSQAQPGHHHHHHHHHQHHFQYPSLQQQQLTSSLQHHSHQSQPPLQHQAPTGRYYRAQSSAAAIGQLSQTSAIAVIGSDASHEISSNVLAAGSRIHFIAPEGTSQHHHHHHHQQHQQQQQQRPRSLRSSTAASTVALMSTQPILPRTLPLTSHRDQRHGVNSGITPSIEQVINATNNTSSTILIARNHNSDGDDDMDVEDALGSDRENWADVDEYHDNESDAMSDVENADDEDGEYNQEEEEDDAEDEEADDYGEPVVQGEQQAGQTENDERAKEMQEQQLELRKQIQLIQNDSNFSGAEKAKRIQELMTRRWTTKVQKENHKEVRYINRLANKKKDFSLVTDDDKQKSYYAPDILGCKHYQRGAKIQAHCCGKWDPCRFCHDEVSDHTITRNLVMTMMCMHCWTVQPAGQDCINTDCGKRVARYYCKECKLWDDDPRKTIYHCYDCGICRIGKGLGIDYFHCPTCNVCMAIGLKGRHKCIERNLESDCPICGEYMFTSTSTVIFMPCGHCMHHKCHQQYIQTSYQCPTCLKSLADMTDYFRRIDNVLSQHQMPPEYNDTFSYIYCNDCEKKSYAKFHFIYHKCAFCRGYNTKLLQTRTGLPPDAPIARDLPPASAHPQAQERPAGSDPQQHPPPAQAPAPAQVISTPQPQQSLPPTSQAQLPPSQTPQHALSHAPPQLGGLRTRPEGRSIEHTDNSQGSSSSDQDSQSQVGPNLSSGSSAGESRSFWCHRCQLPTQLFQDGTTLRCVTCSSDFVEEL